MNIQLLLGTTGAREGSSFSPCLTYSLCHSVLRARVDLEGRLAEFVFSLSHSLSPVHTADRVGSRLFPASISQLSPSISLSLFL